jgi:hypothetical protein
MTQLLLEDLSERFKISLTSPYGNVNRVAAVRQELATTLIKVFTDIIVGLSKMANRLTDALLPTISKTKKRGKNKRQLKKAMPKRPKINNLNWIVSNGPVCTCLDVIYKNNKHSAKLSKAKRLYKHLYKGRNRNSPPWTKAELILSMKGLSSFALAYNIESVCKDDAFGEVFFPTFQGENTTLKIRRHRRDLMESMATCKVIPATKEAICRYLNADTCFPFLPEELASLEVKPYCGEDKRIGWDQTYIVTINSQAVAFTDGPFFE